MLLVKDSAGALKKFLVQVLIRHRVCDAALESTHRAGFGCAILEIDLYDCSLHSDVGIWFKLDPVSSAQDLLITTRLRPDIFKCKLAVDPTGCEAVLQIRF